MHLYQMLLPSRIRRLQVLGELRRHFLVVEVVWGSLVAGFLCRLRAERFPSDHYVTSLLCRLYAAMDDLMIICAGGEGNEEGNGEGNEEANVMKCVMPDTIFQDELSCARRLDCGHR
jgi:hypothetical protein